MKKEQLMQAAIDLSRKKMRSGEGGPFGALVVKGGKIIGRGWNKVTSTNDPTAHAEITAIRSACKELKTFDLSGCEIYSSCMPCPMCLSAIYWARIQKIYFANTAKDAEHIGFDDAFVYRELRKAVGKRSIPFEQLMRNTALEVFQEWEGKEDKIAY